MWFTLDNQIIIPADGVFHYFEVPATVSEHNSNIWTVVATPFNWPGIGWLEQIYPPPDETWKWAGIFRKIELNLGIDWILISEELQKLCDNGNYSISVGSVGKSA